MFESKRKNMAVTLRDRKAGGFYLFRIEKISVYSSSQRKDSIKSARDAINRCKTDRNRLRVREGLGNGMVKKNDPCGS